MSVQCSIINLIIILLFSVALQILLHFQLQIQLYTLNGESDFIVEDDFTANIAELWPIGVGSYKCL